MKRKVQQHSKLAQRGQSLVEVALFFPIFIILLAGLVEVSQLLVTQNRVSSAARASTRFASNGGQDEGMVTIIMNNITQTLETDESVWDIWSIRATVGDAGDCFNCPGGSWTFTHIYGISNTVRAESLDPQSIQTRVLNEIQRDEFGNTVNGIASGLQIVGTYAIHDVDSILGLDAMSQLAGFSSINGLNVMRITANTQNVTNGCSGFPIVIEEGRRSMTEAEYIEGAAQLGSGNGYPQPPPAYNSFIHHTPDVPLLAAEEGDMFFLQTGGGGGQFGWLTWNAWKNSSANNLEGSLSWPGDSEDYDTVETGITPPGFDHPVVGYVAPDDPTDTSMHIGDWITGEGGSIVSSGVRNTLEGHIEAGRTLRVIVYNNFAEHINSPGGPNDPAYQISGFAIFRLHGYKLGQGGGESYILAEFIRWDNSCGQPAQ